MAVAAGLECGTEYDFSLSASTRHPRHVDLGGVSPHVFTSAETGECGQPDRVTNLLVSIGPDFATLTWTPPTDGRAVGYGVERFTYIHDGTEWVKARDWTRLPDGGANAGEGYEDRSAHYPTENGGHVYWVYALTADGETYGDAITAIRPYGPFSVPEAPRQPPADPGHPEGAADGVGARPRAVADHGICSPRGPDAQLGGAGPVAHHLPGGSGRCSSCATPSRSWSTGRNTS